MTIKQLKEEFWSSVKEKLPTKNGQYLTFTRTPKYTTMSFTQFVDGEFMSSFVTHWAELEEPSVEESNDITGPEDLENENDLVEERIETIRSAIPNSEKYFTEGGCYQFALIMKFLYPSSILYFWHWGKETNDQEIVEHVIVKINNKFYDINGEFKPIEKQIVLPLIGKHLRLAKTFYYTQNEL